jgi:hypothetical protein
MTTFRTFTNRPGITYNADKTEVLFAEDLNQIAEAINTLEEEGVVGPEGPTGPTGPAGADGEDGSDGADGESYTRALQNLTNVATVTPDGTQDEHVNISALAQNLTIANPSGALSEGKFLTIRIKPDATPRTLTFGSKYIAFGSTLPTTTVANKKIIIGAIYNAGLDKVEIISVVNEA